MEWIVRQKQRRGAWLSTLLAALAVFVPQVARANSMSGLGYVVIVWPSMAVAAVVLLVLGVIALVRYRRGVSGMRALGFGKACLSFGIAGSLLVAAITLGVEWQDGLAHLDIALYHILVFEILALPSLLFGALLLRRGNSLEPTDLPG